MQPFRLWRAFLKDIMEQYLLMGKQEQEKLIPCKEITRLKKKGELFPGLSNTYTKQLKGRREETLWFKFLCFNYIMKIL